MEGPWAWEDPTGCWKVEGREGTIRQRGLRTGKGREGTCEKTARTWGGGDVGPRWKERGKLRKWRDVRGSQRGQSIPGKVWWDGGGE